MASQSIYAPKPVVEPEQEDDKYSEDEAPPPNPYLKRPILYLSGVESGVSDRELANGVFSPFVPVRLKIDRSGALGAKAKGTVEFQTLEKAEQALATVQALQLSINEDASTDPKAKAKTRLIKQLPDSTDDVDVFNIFRPYGPIRNAQRILTNPQGLHTGFRRMALVTFYNEENAQRAQSELHCAEVEGNTISVSLDNTTRKPAIVQPAIPSFSAAAAPFVPSTPAVSTSQTMSASAPIFQPPNQRTSAGTSASPILDPSNALKQQNGSAMMPAAGTNLHYPSRTAATIDPCNLFIKNLDPNIDSNFLFNLFKDFGRIVSARVMRDERGVSREFGFVSFRFPGDADRALQAMNDTTHGTKKISVRLHEPKSIRQDRKTQNKSANPYKGPLDYPVGNSGPSSEANESSGGSQSPPMERSREASSGQNGVGQVDVEQLKMMSSSVRTDFIRGELSRSIRSIGGIESDQVDHLVSEVSKLKLIDAVDALNSPNLLAQRVKEVQVNGHVVASPLLPSSELMSPNLSFNSERERLLHAVTTLLPVDSPVEDITDLLVGLPKKERAMALFNQEYLQRKVDEARAILELVDDDDDDEEVAQQEQVAPSTTPLTKENIDLATISPHTTNTALAHDDKSTHNYTLSDLAKMPALEIIKLTTNPQMNGLPLPKADPKIIDETNVFIDSLQSLTVTDQKQKLGDQLFKKIRTFGVKGAPKITITLLDSEDLRSLAHLLHSYPECLREKVLYSNPR